MIDITSNFWYGCEIKHDSKEEYENGDGEISPLDSAKVFGADMRKKDSTG